MSKDMWHPEWGETQKDGLFNTHTDDCHQVQVTVLEITVHPV